MLRDMDAYYAWHREWYGHAEVRPGGPIVAGRWGTWQLVYTAGRYGLDNGGMFKVAWRFASDWGEPQTADPGAPNYLSLHTDADARIRARYEFKGHERPFYRALWVEAYDGEVAPGQQVVLTFGDTSAGSPGHLAPTAADARSEWLILVDPLGTRKFERLVQCPVVAVVSGPAERLVAVLPSNATAGAPCPLAARAEDRWGNPAVGYQGVVAIQFVDEAGAPRGEEIRRAFPGGGALRVEDLRLPGAGTYRARVADPAAGFVAESNPCVCRPEAPALRRFWGDLHGQSRETLGLGTVAEYYTYARDQAAVDFASNQGNDIDITADGWAAIRKAARDFHQPGRFVTFPGYEWSGNTSGGGDHNVLFLGDDPPLHRSSHSSVPDKSDWHTDRYPLDRLYAEFAGRDDVILIPHVGGRYCNLDWHDPALEPVLEIYSNWGLFEWLLADALRRGYRMGVVGTSDDHKGRPGAAAPGAHIFGVYGGLTCILAPVLTREALFSALKARRCYATSGQRILVEATANGLPIGADLGTPASLRFAVRVAGTAGVERVELWRYRAGAQGPEVAASAPIPADAPLSNRVRIAWAGQRQVARYFQTVWDGRVSLSDGEIVAAEGYAFDTPLERIVEQTPRSVVWRSQTCGDEDGVILTCEAPPPARLRFETAPCSFEVALGEIGREPMVYPAGGLNQRVTVCRLPAVPFPREVSWQHEETPDGAARAYYLKVVQEDGAVAITSPFYLDAP